VVAVRACLRRAALDRKLRLLGVRVASLVRPGEEGRRTGPESRNDSLPLFD